MSYLARLVVIIAVLGTIVFQYSKKPTPPATFEDAPVKARQGLLHARSDTVLAINGLDYIYGFGGNRYLEMGLVGFDSVPIPELVSDQRNWRFVHSGTWVALAIDQYGKLFRRPHLDQENITADQRASLGQLVPYLQTNPDDRFLKAMEVYGVAAALDTTQRLWVWRETLEHDPGRFPNRYIEPEPPRTEVYPPRKWRDFCVSDEALLTEGPIPFSSRVDHAGRERAVELQCGKCDMLFEAGLLDKKVIESSRTGMAENGKMAFETIYELTDLGLSAYEPGTSDIAYSNDPPRFCFGKARVHKIWRSFGPVGYGGQKNLGLRYVAVLEKPHPFLQDPRARFLGIPLPAGDPPLYPEASVTAVYGGKNDSIWMEYK